MSDLILVAIDLVAIAVLTFALYLPRHGRRQMVVAFLIANIGVVAVTMALTASTVGAGLGLGLFGILSIIRLRSTELDHAEVAYYFAALALGLLAGLAVTPTWISAALSGLIIGALYVGDHPSLFPGYRSDKVTVDIASADPERLRARLLRSDVWSEEVIALAHITPHEIDLVRDTTVAVVRYRAVGTATTERPQPTLIGKAR